MKLLLLIPFLLFIGEVQCERYYFDSLMGDDNDIGTDIFYPFKSLTKLATLSLNPGDVVSFCRGRTFYADDFSYASGTSGNYITYNDYGGNEDKPRFTHAVEILRNLWIRASESLEYRNHIEYTSINYWVLNDRFTTVTGNDKYISGTEGSAELVLGDAPSTSFTMNSIIDVHTLTVSANDGVSGITMRMIIPLATFDDIDQYIEINLDWCTTTFPIEVRFYLVPNAGSTTRTYYPVTICNPGVLTSYESIKTIFKPTSVTNSLYIDIVVPPNVTPQLIVQSITATHVSMMGEMPYFDNLIDGTMQIDTIWMGDPPVYADYGVQSTLPINEGEAQWDTQTKRLILNTGPGGIHPNDKWGPISVAMQNYQIIVNSQDFVIFENLWFDKMNKDATSFLIGPGSEHMIIRNCDFSHLYRDALDIRANNDIIVEYCLFSWIRYYAIDIREPLTYAERLIYFQNNDVSIHHNIFLGCGRSFFVSFNEPEPCPAFHFAHNLIVDTGLNPTSNLVLESSLPEVWIHNNILVQYNPGIGYYFSGLIRFNFYEMEPVYPSLYQDWLTTHLHIYGNNLWMDYDHIKSLYTLFDPYLFFEDAGDVYCYHDEDPSNCFFNYGISQNPFINYSPDPNNYMNNDFHSDCSGATTFSHGPCPYCQPTDLDFEGIAVGLNPAIGPFQTCTNWLSVPSVSESEDPSVSESEDPGGSSSTVNPLFFIIGGVVGACALIGVFFFLLQRKRNQIKTKIIWENASKFQGQGQDLGSGDTWSNPSASGISNWSNSNPCDNKSMYSSASGSTMSMGDSYGRLSPVSQTALSSVGTMAIKPRPSTSSNRIQQRTSNSYSSRNQKPLVRKVSTSPQRRNTGRLTPVSVNRPSSPPPPSIKNSFSRHNARPSSPPLLSKPSKIQKELIDLQGKIPAQVFSSELEMFENSQNM